jgi:hypothetical protein
MLYKEKNLIHNWSKMPLLFLPARAGNKWAKVLKIILTILSVAQA